MKKEYSSNLKEKWVFNPLMYNTDGQLLATEAIAQLMHTMKTNYFVTIAFNPPTQHQNKKQSREYFRNMLSTILLQFDKNCLGKKYVQNKKHTHKRCSGIIIPEHESSNYHYHLLLKIPTCDNAELVKFHLYGALNKSKCARVSLDVQTIHNVDGLAEYVAKEFHSKNWADKFSAIIYVSEFHPKYK
jgi:hypothetical protein